VKKGDAKIGPDVTMVDAMADLHLESRARKSRMRMMDFGTSS